VTPRKRATLGILFGIFLAAMDSTIVMTALPTIVSEFNHVELYFLPISIAMIVSTIAVTVVGRFSDRYGRKRFHLIGIAFFTIGSALCSLSNSMEMLVSFRAIQAAGQGALMTLSYTMIADLYPLEERAKMQGSIGGVWGLAALLGPWLGGMITEKFGWEFVFLATLPLGFISLAIIQKHWVDRPRTGPAAKPDVPGAVLLALASACLLGAFALVRHPEIDWTSPLVFSLSVGAVVFAALLVLVERRSKDPFMAVDLFRNRLFWTGTLCSSLLAADMFCAFAYLTLFAQSVIGSKPMMTGMVLAPMMFAWVACSATGGFLLLRVGYRSLAIAGSLLSMIAYLILGRLGVGSSWAAAAGAGALLGAGLGFVLTPLLIAAQNSVGSGRLGSATSLTQFCRSMTGAIGIAIAGAIMGSIIASHGLDPDAVVNPVLSKELPPEVARSMRGVMEDSLRPVFMFGLVAASLAFLSALLLPAGRARDLRSAEAARTPDSPRG
jgi:EmrB/QacA subfamily drug resistance transporter